MDTGHASFKARLLALRDELEAALRGFMDAHTPVDLDEPIGRLSRMDAIQQKKMMAAGRQNLAIRLSQVKRALLAIEDGTYGECLRCEEPIAPKRLAVRPESPFCMACQQEREAR